MYCWVMSDQEGLGLSEEDQIFGSGWGWVDARTSCDHLASLSADLTHIPPPHTPCHRCQHASENWLCLSCKQVLCSRYVNKHMLHHCRDTNHSLALSFNDLSVWCFSCDAYLDAQLIPQLRPVHQVVYKLKFGDGDGDGDSINKSILNVRDSPKFCKCGALSKLKISWSKNNPGRRFYGCGKYNKSILHCDYLIWFDPPTNIFHVNLFNDLWEDIKKLKLEVETHRHRVSAMEKFGALGGKNNVSSTLYVESLCDLQNDIKNLKVEMEVQKTNLEVLQQKVGTEKTQVELLTGKIEYYKAKVKTLNFIILGVVILLVGKWVN
ncbi:Histone deacetylase 6 [Spatholobus suberectus]|nr:Histone deacetylase 6 [Spatholobus suberectus]